MEEMAFCMHLQKALGHYSLGDLRETLLEVLQDVVVKLRASLCHHEPRAWVTEPTSGSAAPVYHLSSPAEKAHENWESAAYLLLDI